MSTGEVADLCSVARDTVVKWIRRGRLAATRTTGGHYRVAWDDIQRMVPASVSAESSALRQTGIAVSPIRCWGYLSRSGEPREECRGCLAYRVGATWCFLLRKDRGEGGASFCGGPPSCEDCPYYRRVIGLPTRVLVITADEKLEEALRGGNAEDLEYRFGRTGYEAAASISGFYPSIAVVDAEVDHGDGARLVAHLSNDARIHGVRIILAVARRGMPAYDAGHAGGCVEVLKKPLGFGAILSLRDRFPVEPLDPRRKEEVASLPSGTSR